MTVYLCVKPSYNYLIDYILSYSFGIIAM